MSDSAISTPQKQISSKSKNNNQNSINYSEKISKTPKNNNINNNENITRKDYEILSEDNPYYDLSFKIIIIGNPGVGKSCLSLKATKNVFNDNYSSTIGFEFFKYNIKFHDTVIRLLIWDTCGQEIYRSLVSNFYHNSSLAIIVYSIIE